MKAILLVLSLFPFIASINAEAELPRTKAPKGAEAYIISPKNGAVVTSPVKVIFGLKKMGVAPAGVKNPRAGHHHLLINSKLKQFNLPIPSDENHKHFGGGQTETAIELKPGKHTLQLVLGDHLHIPHDPPIQSKVISITVK